GAPGRAAVGGRVGQRALDDAGLGAGRGVAPVGKDRPNRRRAALGARDRPGLQGGEDRALGARDREGAAPADPALHARPARPDRARAARRRLPAAGRRPTRPRSAAERCGRGSARVRPERLPRRRRVLGAGRGRAPDGGRPRRAHPRRRRPARPEGRRVPVVVPAVVDVPCGAGMSVATNPEQAAAVEARGRVFVSAGAGTGKTAVLVERFVRAVCDEGIDVDSMLVITYTKRAAGELRSRIRSELHARGRHDLARELDGAWVSTIHGFCNRLLKAYPFQAGLDPRFRELDEAQAAVLRSEAFDTALDAFCTDDDPDRLRVLATYTAAGLRRMLTGIYETLRSAGRPLVLELGDASPLADRVAELRVAAQCLADDADASELQRANAAR